MDDVALLGVVAALIAVLSTLVGGLIFVVKRLFNRSDAALEARDKEVLALLAVTRDQAEHQRIALSELRKAIESFSRFEAEEERIHKEILNRLDCHDTLLTSIAGTQEKTAQLLDRLLAKMKV